MADLTPMPADGSPPVLPLPTAGPTRPDGSPLGPAASARDRPLGDAAAPLPPADVATRPGRPSAGLDVPAPVGVQEWGACEPLLDLLGRSGMPDADEFVLATRRSIRPPDVQRFFGAITPDPTLGAVDLAREPRLQLGLSPALPGSLQQALAELLAQPAADCPPDVRDARDRVRPLAEFTQQGLGMCPHCHEPMLPPWVDRARLLQGQRAFMTRLLPSVLVLLCKSLPEAYSAARPAAVLNLSRSLGAHPYHRLLGTLQLLVTVSTPYSFEGPYYPARVAAEQMRLLHAGVRSIVAPAMRAPSRGPIERTDDGFTGPEFELWPGYDRFTRPHGGEEATQVPVSLEDMLATIMAFSLLVVQGLEKLETPLGADDAEAFYHVWRVFAVLMGIHPPGRPDDPSWVPATLAEADAFWQLYRRRHLAGPTRRTAGYRDQAKRENPSGYALASAHVNMLGSLLRHELRWLPIADRRWANVPRFYLEHLGGEEGAARLGQPPSTARPLIRLVLVDAPRLWARLWRRVDPGIHTAASRRFLTALIGRVYGPRVVYPIPHSAEDLRRFVLDTPGRRVPEWLRTTD